MKKRYLASIVGMVALSLSASAVAGTTTRTASGSYNTMQGEANDGPGVEGSFSNGVSFVPKAGEQAVSVTIKDRSGLPTRALVVQERGRWGSNYLLKREICGRTKAPIRFKPGIEVRVIVQDGPCADGTMATATFGTVKATFTR